jgi:gluconate 2-dehydrogenase gamma chain
MNFFYQLKKLTLAGYYTSEIGFSRELGKKIIPPSHAGCAPIQGRA